MVGERSVDATIPLKDEFCRMLSSLFGAVVICCLNPARGTGIATVEKSYAEPGESGPDFSTSLAPGVRS